MFSRAARVALGGMAGGMAGGGTQRPGGWDAQGMIEAASLVPTAGPGAVLNQGGAQPPPTGAGTAGATATIASTIQTARAARKKKRSAIVNSGAAPAAGGSVLGRSVLGY